MCFCLGLQILANDNFDATARALIFGTTMVVIVLTVLGMGGLTPVMLKKLKLDGTSYTERAHAAGGEHGGGTGGDGPGGDGHGGNGEEGDDVRGMLKRDESLPEGGMKPTLMRWIEFDQRYISFRSPHSFCGTEGMFLLDMCGHSLQDRRKRRVRSMILVYRLWPCQGSRFRVPREMTIEKTASLALMLKH